MPLLNLNLLVLIGRFFLAVRIACFAEDRRAGDVDVRVRVI